MANKLIRCIIARKKRFNRRQLRNSGVSQWKYQKIKNCSNNRGNHHQMLQDSFEFDRKNKRKKNLVSTSHIKLMDSLQCFDDSDDDFIVFERLSPCESENESENLVKFIDIKNTKKKNKKVSFNLQPIIYMLDFEDNDLNRKGPWQTYALDRKRFHDRIMIIEDKLKNIFNEQHRNNVWKNYHTSQINYSLGD